MKIEMAVRLQNSLWIKDCGLLEFRFEPVHRRKMGATGEYEYIVSEVSKATDFCGIS
jgi:hypothetical protein